MSDRDKAGLRGPVKTVLEEQTFSGADGQQSFTTTTTQYAPDGRILEDRTGNPNGPGWVTSYAYYSDGRLLKTAFGKRIPPSVLKRPTCTTTHKSWSG